MVGHSNLPRTQAWKEKIKVACWAQRKSFLVCWQIFIGGDVRENASGISWICSPRVRGQVLPLWAQFLSPKLNQKTILYRQRSAIIVPITRWRAINRADQWTIWNMRLCDARLLTWRWGNLSSQALNCKLYSIPLCHFWSCKVASWGRLCLQGQVFIIAPPSHWNVSTTFVKKKHAPIRVLSSHVEDSNSVDSRSYSNV